MDGSASEAEHSPGISLIIPAFNEAEGIADMISKAAAGLASACDDYEIIVVDDGSSDATFENARHACRDLPQARVIRHEPNRGYGAAIRTGFNAAQKDLLVFTDADCQFDMTELPRFTRLSANYDVVCGYRIDRQDTWPRKMYSKVYNVLVRTLFGIQIRDIDCAFKMFHRRHRAQLAITTDGFLVNTELLSQAKHGDLSIVEVGVTHLPRRHGRTTVSIYHILPVLIGLVQLWWNRVMFPGAPHANLPLTQNGDRRWRWSFTLVALLAALMLFTNLGYPLIDRDETRYAEIPREILYSGNWLAPQLNFRPYYDKPPLLYWLCAASYESFGVSEWSARIVPAASAFLLVMSTMWFGCRMFDLRVGVLGGLVLLATVGFLFCGRFLIIDALLSLLVAGSFFTAHEAIKQGALRWRWWLLSAFCCGIGVLAKGPIAGVLLGPPLLLFAWLTDTSAQIRIHHWLAFAVVVAGTAGIWFVPAAYQDPHFLYEFFYKHNIARFAGAYHERPFWYFLPVVLVGGHPWTFLLIPYAQFLARGTRTAGSMRPPSQAFLLLWLFWCVFFFSVSKGKLPTYILPAAPAFALLVAHYLDHAIFRSPQCDLFFMTRWLSPWLATATTCLAGMAIGYAAFSLQLHTQVAIVASTIGWGVIGILCLWAFRRIKDTGMRWCVCTSLALLLVVQGTQFWVPQLGRTPALIMPAQELAQWAADDNQMVATFGHEWSGVPFYSGRNDIKNFKGNEGDELSEFVANNASTLIIVRGRKDAEKLRCQLPEHLRITLLEEAVGTSILLAEHQPDFPAAARVRKTVQR